MIEPEIIKGKGLWGGNIIIFETLPSTNLWAMDNASTCMHGDVIIALTQTEGYGRFKRKWHVIANKSLALSVIIKAKHLDSFFISIMPMITAFALKQMLDDYEIKALLKWPNDVMVNYKKIAGILTEKEPTDEILVIGIGLNVNISENDFKSWSLIQPATSMSIESGKTLQTKEIYSNLIARLENSINSARKDSDSFLTNIWRQCDALSGKQITIQTGRETITGKYSGLDKTGRLILTDNKGFSHSFYSGDVTICNSLI